ncbi:cold-shock protein [Francisella hispaniensis]|uniref:Cold shock protein n=1 Tax=Francisella hispaniensis TaxID=622488 RepID=F4BG97_9GAMM|nr:cold shock domain-containing protein [Francisella hispaniensis]AEE26491.1 Cold shock protein [Francisella hispaniensis]
MQGTVKFYNKDKGYGFIYSEESEKDFFFSINDWKNPTVPNGSDDVEFEVAQSKKGEKAISIKLLKSAEDKKQQQFNSNDSRITCPSCSRKIVPRMITYKGEPEKSVCPYCAALIKSFDNFTILPFLTIGIIVIIVLIFVFGGK